MNLNSGGAERQIVTMACNFKQLGYDVEVACFAEGNFYQKHLEQNGVKVLWIFSSNLIKRTLQFRKLIRKGGYDVVISYLDSSNFLNTFATIGGRKWKVVTGERSAKEENFCNFKGRLFAWMQRNADAIVCNSENARHMWIKYYPQYEFKLKTIYNLIDITTDSDSYEVRVEGKIHIVVAASYQRLKNPLGLIEAVNMLPDVEKKFLRIDWYGQRDFPESIASECDSLVERYHLNGVIAFHDRVANVTEIMGKADAVGLFSSVEGLPNAICEAMSLGKPIVMTRVSDYKVLVDEDNGFLCDWDNVESISEALRNLMKCSNEQLLKMGKKSKEKADALFAKDVIINSWLSLMQ